MFEWNWADLIIAFLGFLGAIGAAVLASKICDLIMVKRIIKRIVKELNNEVAEIDDDNIINDIKNGVSFSYRLIYLPYIESLKTTNQILLLSSKTWYNALFELDYMIGEVNRWATIASEYYIKHKENDNQWKSDDMYKSLCETVACKCAKYKKKVKKLLCEICL